MLSRYCYFLLGAARPFVFLVGDGLFSPNILDKVKACNFVTIESVIIAIRPYT